MVQVRNEILEIQNLKPELDGYCILHLSDIHFKGHVARDSTLRKILNSGVADIILITGDFITGNEDIDPVIDYLRDIRARDGVYGILGNHDYVLSTIYHHARYLVTKNIIPNDWKRLLRSLEKINIKMLINQYAVVKTRGTKVFIEGTDDPYLGTPKIADVDLEYISSNLKILMSHSPDILYSKEMQKKKFDILLSGHTHGGQIRLPRIGPVATATKFATRREAYGLYKRQNMYVNVSAGIGRSALPIRINCPPEVSILRLRCL